MRVDRLELLSELLGEHLHALGDGLGVRQAARPPVLEHSPDARAQPGAHGDRLLGVARRGPLDALVQRATLGGEPDGPATHLGHVLPINRRHRDAEALEDGVELLQPAG